MSNMMVTKFRIGDHFAGWSATAPHGQNALTEKIPCDSFFSVHNRTRAVAQRFSVLVWGTRGRRFKSAQPEDGKWESVPPAPVFFIALGRI